MHAYQASSERSQEVSLSRRQGALLSKQAARTSNSRLALLLCRAGMGGRCPA